MLWCVFKLDILELNLTNSGRWEKLSRNVVYTQSAKHCIPLGQWRRQKKKKKRIYGNMTFSLLGRTDAPKIVKDMLRFDHPNEQWKKKTPKWYQFRHFVCYRHIHNQLYTHHFNKQTLSYPWPWIKNHGGCKPMHSTPVSQRQVTKEMLQ